MKENSLITQLYNLVKDNEFVSINAINDLTEQLEYKISNGERRMRDLVKKNLVKKITDNGVIIGYKPLPFQKLELKEELKHTEPKQQTLFTAQPKIY
jgi:predicted transcriptional regulator